MVMTEMVLSRTETEFVTEDGVTLKGTIIAPETPEAVMAIHPATGYLARFYADFAEASARQGWAVLIYDYRGQGRSRTHALKDDPSTMMEWGRYDMPAACRHICNEHKGLPLDYIGHSVGGHCAALTPQDLPVRRLALIAAGSGYWGYHNWFMGLQGFILWWVVGPIKMAMTGGLAKGGPWTGDSLPKGVFQGWRAACSSAEGFVPILEKHGLLEQFQSFNVPTRSFCALDDPIGNVRCIQWLLDQLGCQDKGLIKVSPEEMGQGHIGHDGLFRAKMAEVFWPKVFAWLKTGQD